MTGAVADPDSKKAQMQLKIFLALAALAVVPSEGAENRAATGLASEVAGLLRGNAIVTKSKCHHKHHRCRSNGDCCSGNCTWTLGSDKGPVCLPA